MYWFTSVLSWTNDSGRITMPWNWRKKIAFFLFIRLQYLLKFLILWWHVGALNSISGERSKSRCFPSFGKGLCEVDIRNFRVPKLCTFFCTYRVKLISDWIYPNGAGHSIFSSWKEKLFIILKINSVVMPWNCTIYYQLPIAKVDCHPRTYASMVL